MFSEELTPEELNLKKKCFGFLDSNEKRKPSLYDRIKVVHITMKSMEAKELLERYVFSHDGQYLI
jgi:hypothetical protein